MYLISVGYAKFLYIYTLLDYFNKDLIWYNEMIISLNFELIFSL